MNRRAFLAALGGAVLDPERLLWVPGRKLISIPPARLLPNNVPWTFLGASDLPIEPDPLLQAALASLADLPWLMFARQMTREEFAKMYPRGPSRPVPNPLGCRA